MTCKSQTCIKIRTTHPLGPFGLLTAFRTRTYHWQHVLEDLVRQTGHERREWRSTGFRQTVRARARVGRLNEEAVY